MKTPDPTSELEAHWPLKQYVDDQVLKTCQNTQTTVRCSSLCYGLSFKSACVEVVYIKWDKNGAHQEQEAGDPDRKENKKGNTPGQPAMGRRTWLFPL